MFCDVAVPNTPLDELTYRFDPGSLGELAPGDCVRVRLRGKKVKAVVVALRETSPVKRVVALDEVVERDLLSPGLLELVLWLRQYYFGSLGEVFGHVLPRGIGGYRPRKAVSPIVQDAVQNLVTPVEALAEVDFDQFGVHFSGRAANRLRLVADFVQRARERGAVVLMLPEQELASWAGRLGDVFGDALVEYHAGLGTTRMKQAWQRIRRSESVVVVGVRSAAFAPVSRLGGAAVLDGHDKTYKEERFPRFHARDTVIARAKAAGCPVLLCDRTPSVETWHNLKDGRYQLAEGFTAHEERVGAFTVDMRKHPGRLFSPRLKREIERASGLGSVVLYVNRFGVSRHVVCKDCGVVLECNDCFVPFVLDTSGNLTCGYCGRSMKAPESCPECSGAEFQYRAPGIDMVEREVSRLFPGLRVVKVTGKSDTGMTDDCGVVFVGTRTLLSRPWPSTTRLVGVVRLDYDLALPDFRARERAFQSLFEMERRCADLDAGLVVQTWRPGETLIGAAFEQDPASFLDRELELRKGQDFPPWRRLASLEVRGTNVGLVRTQAERLARMMNRVKGVEVLGPVPVMRGPDHSWKLLVKTAGTIPLGRVLDRSVLEARGVATRVDVDPLEIV